MPGATSVGGEVVTQPEVDDGTNELLDAVMGESATVLPRSTGTVDEDVGQVPDCANELLEAVMGECATGLPRPAGTVDEDAGQGSDCANELLEAVRGECVTGLPEAAVVVTEDAGRAGEEDGASKLLEAEMDGRVVAVSEAAGDK